jgi:hypothetical protein
MPARFLMMPQLLHPYEWEERSLRRQLLEDDIDGHVGTL